MVRRAKLIGIMLAAGFALTASGLALILPIFLGRFEVAQWAPEGAVLFTVGLICIISAIAMVTIPP